MFARVWLAVALLFLDESGDTGFKFERGSSRLLVACLVGFDSDGEYAKSSAALAVLRTQLRWDPSREFKFSAMNHRLKAQAIEAAGAGEFWFHAFALNKPKLWDNALRNKHQMYRKVVGWLFENAVADASGSHIVLDRCGNRDFYRMIHSQVRFSCVAAKQPPPTQFEDKESHESDGLQIADLVVGAVARLYSRKPNCHDLYSQISRRVRSLRHWPS